MTDSYTHLFRSPQGVYALSHSIGPLSLASIKANDVEYFEAWSKYGSDTWPHWLAKIDEFCEAVGLVINARDHDICPQANLASGFSAFLTAIAKLPKHKHQRTIVMHEDAFASMGFVVQGLMPTFGFELVLLSGDPNDHNLWLDALEQHQVLACLITHVHSNTSIKSDCAKLCSLVKQFEALSLVDIAQSIGIVPIDVDAWDADAVFGSCVKWLCGGPGAGFMYINRNLTGYLHPDPVGWFSHQQPFEFNIRRYQANDSAKRFWGGTPSVQPYIVANAAIRQLLALGLDNVAQHNADLKGILLTEISAFIEPLPYDYSLENLGGSLCVKALDTKRTLSALQAAAVKFDQRGQLIRLSLHLNNQQDDANAIAECFRY